MFSSILALLFGFITVLHTSMAIKCITQPNIEEEKNFYKQFPKGQEHDPEKIKQEFLRVSKTTGEMDCAKIALEYGLAEPTQCASSEDLGNCTGFALIALFKGVSPAEFPELQGIKAKGCHFEELAAGIEFSSSNKLGHVSVEASAGAAAGSFSISDSWTPEDACRSLEKLGCPGCQVCNDVDYCNAGVKDGPIPALFLLLLAIASGTFRWTAFH